MAQACNIVVKDVRVFIYPADTNCLRVCTGQQKAFPFTAETVQPRIPFGKERSQKAVPLSFAFKYQRFKVAGQLGNGVDFQKTI